MYLQNFWIPKEGHNIVYQDIKYTIEEIIEGAQAKCKDYDRIVWLQDIAWKPELSDIDEIVMRLGGTITGDKICVSIKNKRSYFVRPDTLPEYEKVVRQIRVYTAMRGAKLS